MGIIPIRVPSARHLAVTSSTAATATSTIDWSKITVASNNETHPCGGSGALNRHHAFVEHLTNNGTTFVLVQQWGKRFHLPHSGNSSRSVLRFCNRSSSPPKAQQAVFEMAETSRFELHVLSSDTSPLLLTIRVMTHHSRNGKAVCGIVRAKPA